MNSYEEFWDLYSTSSVLEIFEETCDFFKKELPQDFLENYDVGEIIVETNGQLKEKKNIENIIKFSNILKEHQPLLYDESFEYFESFLVSYYCFKNNIEEVNNSFSRFIENPDQSVDYYTNALETILLYQYSELLDEIIEKNFETLKDSFTILSSVTYPLALCKLYMVLQEKYKSNEESLDESTFTSLLSQLDFDFPDYYISSMELGLLKPQLDTKDIIELFKNDKVKSLKIIFGYFLRYMHEKGFEFYLSRFLWDSMDRYWVGYNEDKDIIDSYFKVDRTTFGEYLDAISSDFFHDYRNRQIATLWGSVYIYEFLYQNKFISEGTYLDFIEISKVLKGITISGCLPSLWKFDFVHQWQKPDSISEVEFEEEKKIFEKSFSLKYKKFSNLRSEIADELSNIGELSSHIIKGAKSPQNTETILDIMSKKTHQSSKPVKVENKVGRNDPCTCGSGKKYKKCCG